MLDPKSGAIRLTDAEIILPKMHCERFKAQFSDADEDWAHNSRAAYRLSRHYESGWQVDLGLHFTDDQLYDVLCLFNDGNLNSDSPAEAWIRLHRDLLVDWFGKDTPYHYAWGAVQLLTDNPYSQRLIAVQYR